jgi:DNA-binding NarL/FixJ family response regulator
METHTKYKKKVVDDTHRNIMSIFLVDDDLSYLYPLGFYLQKNTPHMVYCYTSGEECLKNMYHAPDIIILDFNLSPEPPNVMNGLEVLKEVKSVSPKTKVVILSGRDTVKGVIDSMNLGAYTYIVKDIEALASLKKIIDTIADKKANDA